MITNDSGQHSGQDPGRRLAQIAPELERLLTRDSMEAGRFAAAEIRRSTVMVTMRDGVRLATDLYLPPSNAAPTLALRTPYGRAIPRLVEALLTFSRCGYAVASQDCRGTGDSEPDSWDYYMYEPEDSYDFVQWITQQQWFDGFIGGCGSSYLAQTQWCMSAHPCMSAIVPEVSGLGIARNTARVHMFLSVYARSIGKGVDKVSMPYPELERAVNHQTLAGGYFNEPLQFPLPDTLLARYPELRTLPSARAKRRLWEIYCALGCSQRADFVKQVFATGSVSIIEVESLSAIFGHEIPHDAHTLPSSTPQELCEKLHAAPLLITGWYDWGLNDALATWKLLQRQGPGHVAARSRLIITPSAHNMPGYHEGAEGHPELQHNHRTLNHVGLLQLWFERVRTGTLDAWPPVIYYLMGANDWQASTAWPPPQARSLTLYLNAEGRLTAHMPEGGVQSDRYTYRPEDPTPTKGGNIVSYVYTPGSVDVSDVQRRSDVLTYTTGVLQQDLDVVGPLRMTLYASSTAVDTDFCARLTDIFPDGRAVQIQSGMLRARYRNAEGEPELLEPERIYRLEIDMWATANRFRAGHRLRIDVSSADFPRFDRNSNTGGAAIAPLHALQTVYRSTQYPSQVHLSALGAFVVQEHECSDDTTGPATHQTEMN